MIQHLEVIETCQLTIPLRPALECVLFTFTRYQCIPWCVGIRLWIIEISSTQSVNKPRPPAYEAGMVTIRLPGLVVVFLLQLALSGDAEYILLVIYIRTPFVTDKDRMTSYVDGSPNLSVTVTNSQAVRRVMMQKPPAPVPVVHREPYPPYATPNNNYTGINRPQRVSSGRTCNIATSSVFLFFSIYEMGTHLSMFITYDLTR